MIQYQLPWLREFAFFLPPLKEWRLKKNLCLLRKVSDLSPSKILEIGCGTGILSRALAKKFPRAQILAIDLSRKMIEKANAKSNPSNLVFKETDFYNVSGSFDLVFSVNAFEEIEPEKGFSHLKNLLSDNGIAYLTLTVPGIFSSLYQRFQWILGGRGPSLESHKFWGEKAKEAGFSVRGFPLIDFERTFLLELRLDTKDAYIPAFH